jgi:pantoate--beta-alanine ligase
VVAKLFNIINPHLAFFGEKDFQQLVVIQRMVKDLGFDVEIIGLPIIREEDGLAMSSRNTYLSKEERKAALSLDRSLNQAKKMYKEGIRDARKIEEEVKQIIREERLAEIEYIKICDKDTLDDIDEIDQKALLALAVKIRKTRLIDNCILGGEGVK